MEVKLNIVGKEALLLHAEVRNSYNQKSNFVEDKITIQNGCIEQLTITNLIGDGIVILDSKMRFATQQVLQLQIHGECVMMNFIYCNNVEIDVDQLDTDLDKIKNTHNILYSDNFKGTLKVPANEEVDCFSIILSLNYYRLLIHNEWELHKKFSNAITQKKSSYLTPKYLPFNKNIQWVIYEIRTCKYEGFIKKMYLEAKIKELLILQFDTLINLNQEKESVNEADYLKLLKAKIILETNFTHAPSIPELSRAVALNEFKLKKGFKTCFETTIKGYVTKLRMEYAINLLKNKVSNVGEVAYKCGYKDVSHFSAAFKLFHGFTPISLLKSSKNINFILLQGSFLALAISDCF
ncbi:helix-turn-helix domain-containing protein [Flavobacterium sandaracinum]|uniref:AraC family transcriptional regulator n=1 Tax=Flavobacterium sandaracinum TaxID=2541733 RepID=A0A4V2Z1Q3_9FLAO|nr:AraC family transcriptional regulator [Flavobacterium sandaracinum]TDE05848.1 AraC family transcriptional regulator [Flavobacterium sandaracinum]